MIFNTLVSVPNLPTPAIPTESVEASLEELVLQGLSMLRPRARGKLDELIDTRIPKLRSELLDRLTWPPGGSVSQSASNE